MVEEGMEKMYKGKCSKRSPASMGVTRRPAVKQKGRETKVGRVPVVKEEKKLRCPGEEKTSPRSWGTCSPIQR